MGGSCALSIDREPLCFHFHFCAGTLLRKQGSSHDLAAASSYLTDALRYQPHNHVGWYNLGLVRKAQALKGEAEQHLFTAVKLAAAAPVLSYSELPLLL